MGLSDVEIFFIFLPCFMLVLGLGFYIRSLLPDHCYINVRRPVQGNTMAAAAGRNSLPTYSDATKNDPPSYTECFRETQQSSTYAVNV